VDRPSTRLHCARVGGVVLADDGAVV
jgi:hypothetical protein